jgi:PadR family transcriptional regulator PadR
LDDKENPGIMTDTSEISEEDLFSPVQIMKGHLTLLLLATLRAEPAHGYAVIERLRTRSNGAFDLQEGTIYPALHRLEKLGLLTSQWSEEQPRRRRIYSLTELGWDTLQRGSRRWNQFADNVAMVLFGQRRDDWV